MDAEAGPSRYSAFISYNHRDVRFARTLQQQIESYRLPRQLRGGAREDPVRPGRLKHCFRDRDDLRAAPDLTASVHEAIAESDYLIVICTPNGAGSEWVGREVTAFRARHGEQSVLAALFAGESAAAFHPALVSTAADGTPIRPLAADFRPGGEGRRLALLKLVAVLAGVRLDSLVQRDAQRRFRQMVVAGIAAAVVLVLIAVFATVALLARADARRTQARGVATVARLVDQREQFKKAGRLELLQAHDRAALDFFKDQDVRALPPEAQLLSAKLLQGISEDDETAGDFLGMRRAALAALATTERMLAAAPNDSDRIYAHAQSEYYVGAAALRLEDYAAAEKHFTAYSRLVVLLVNRDTERADWWKEAGDADSNLGTFLFRHTREIDRAGRLFRSAQRRLKRAAELAPNDSEIGIDLADSYSWLANVFQKRLNYASAVRERQQGQKILLALRERDPFDVQIDVALLKNQLGLAKLAALQHRWRDANAGFRTGLALASAHAKQDPGNADLARQVKAFQVFQLQTWLDMPRNIQPSQEELVKSLKNCESMVVSGINADLTAVCERAEHRLTSLN